jgi:hypothetical protein
MRRQPTEFDFELMRIIEVRSGSAPETGRWFAIYRRRAKASRERKSGRPPTPTDLFTYLCAKELLRSGRATSWTAALRMVTSFRPPKWVKESVNAAYADPNKYSQDGIDKFKAAVRKMAASLPKPDRFDNLVRRLRDDKKNVARLQELASKTIIRVEAVEGPFEGLHPNF